MNETKKNLILNATPRKETGKKIRLSKDTSKIPAVTYGSKAKNESLFLDAKEFKQIYKEAGESTLVDLKISGEPTKKILIQETQFHPIFGKPIHVDLYQVRMDEKIKTEIPLKFIGEAPAVKDLDGTLSTIKTEVKVECLPANLISEIEVDISPLKTFADLIHIQDLKVPETIHILDVPEEVVAQVEEPRSEEELAELEEKPEEKVGEVEVEGEKKEEGEETVEGEEAAQTQTPEETGKGEPVGENKKPQPEEKK